MKGRVGWNRQILANVVRLVVAVQVPAMLVGSGVKRALAAEQVVSAIGCYTVEISSPQKSAGDLRPPRVVIGVYADEPGPVPVVYVERRILADRKHEDHRRRRDLDAAAEQKPVAVERGRVQDDENNGSEVKFGFSSFFYFPRSLGSGGNRMPHTIDATLSPWPRLLDGAEFPGHRRDGGDASCDVHRA